VKTHRIAFLAWTSFALAIALLSVGTGRAQNVIAWGDDSRGQTDVPSSATNIVAVAAGAIMRRTPKSMVMPQSAASVAAPANAEPRLGPAAAEPVSAAPVAAVPPVPPASDVAGLTPVKPSAAKRARASGRPSERPVGRPNGTSTSSAPVAPAPQPEKGSMPPSRFDRENPYAKP